MNTLLELRRVTIGYRATAVVHEFDLTVEDGQSLALLGANGAGKTTLMRAVAGLMKPWAGSIKFRGDDITNIPPEDRAVLGISLAPEGRGIFGTLSIEENLMVGALPLRRRHSKREASKMVREDLEQVYDIFPVLGERRHGKGCNLSGGQQQMLAIGRALMARPSLLLLDEPCLGLAPKVAGEMYASLAALRTPERSIIVVEESARRALDFAERACVMKLGRKVLDRSAAEAGHDHAIIEAYFGLSTEAR